MGFVGDAGYAIVAVSALAGVGVLGFMFVVYAAHIFLTIVIDSGCGIDELSWPREGIFDWLPKPPYLFWLAFGWLLLFGVVLLPLFLHDWLGFVAGLGLALIVVYPITLLSSLSAKSWVAFLHRPLLRRMAGWPMAYLVVLLLSVPLAAGAAALVWFSVGRSLWWALPAGVLMPAVLFWYARLLGRYAWLITHRPLRRKPRPAPKSRAQGVVVEDPWGATPAPAFVPAATQTQPPQERVKLMSEEPAKLMQEEPEDEWTPEKRPYGVMDEEKARASWQERHTDSLEGEAGYDITDAPLAAPFSLTAYYDKYMQEDEARRQRTEPPRLKPTFARAFGAGFWLFPFYTANLRTWIGLSLVTVALLGCLRLVVLAGAVLGVV